MINTLAQYLNKNLNITAKCVFVDNEALMYPQLENATFILVPKSSFSVIFGTCTKKPRLKVKAVHRIQTHDLSCHEPSCLHCAHNQTYIRDTLLLNLIMYNPFVQDDNTNRY
jgi:hypothetical protein